MQEETVPMSEEEASDTEIVMLDPSQPYTKSLQTVQSDDQQLQNQVGMIDTQLKALGLFEEGMSYEQKEELLAVVAASRETARKEESMRMKAKEWTQRVFPEDLQISAVPENPPCLPSASIPLVEVSSSTENSLQSTDVGLRPPLSQDSVEISASSSSRNTVPELHVTCVDEDQQIVNDHQVANTSQRKSDKMVRSNYQSIQVEVCHPQYDSQELEEELDIIEVDFTKQKRDLEKSIPEWKPCSSPDATTIHCSRFTLKQHKSGDESSSENSEEVLHAIDDYHSEIKKFQRSSGNFIPWGQPVTVGRAYATRSSRRNGPDSENSDSLCLFPSGDIRENGNSMCESYMRLRQYSMQLNHGSSTRPTNTSGESKRLQKMANLSIPRVTPFSSNSPKSTARGKKPKFDDSNKTSQETKANQPHILKNFSNRQPTEPVPKPINNRDIESNLNAAVDSNSQHNVIPVADFRDVMNSAENSKNIESRENQNPFSELVNQESPPVKGSQHIVNLKERNATKRKCLNSSSIKTFNSCAKRLKETGTA